MTGAAGAPTCGLRRCAFREAGLDVAGLPADGGGQANPGPALPEVATALASAVDDWAAVRTRPGGRTRTGAALFPALGPRPPILDDWGAIAFGPRSTRPDAAARRTRGQGLAGEHIGREAGAGEPGSPRPRPSTTPPTRPGPKPSCGGPAAPPPAMCGSNYDHGRGGAGETSLSGGRRRSGARHRRLGTAPPRDRTRLGPRLARRKAEVGGGNLEGPRAPGGGYGRGNWPAPSAAWALP